MGTIVPIDPPALDSDAWYLVWVDAFDAYYPPYDCSCDYLGQGCCCVQGSHIDLWQRIYGAECHDGFELCFVDGLSAQRLLNVHGPYTELECNALL
jgi:hypothetical protein